jgi:Kef-type K+ transport system membrane component KefB
MSFHLSPITKGKGNKAQARAIFASLMGEFGIAIFLFFVVVGLLVIQANLSNPVWLNEKLLLFALILFLLYTVYWVVKLFRAFRRPNETEKGGPLI